MLLSVQCICRSGEVWRLLKCSTELPEILPYSGEMKTCAHKVRERKLSYVNAYIRDLEKGAGGTCLQARRRDADAENGRMRTAREGEGGRTEREPGRMRTSTAALRLELSLALRRRTRETARGREPQRQGTVTTYG